MSSWKILVVCAALLAGHVSAFRKRIFNGRDALIKDFPYQVSIRYGNDHLCGGSILSERHILTAAHCIKKEMLQPYFPFRVVTGTNNRLTGGNKHKIAGYKIHPRVECDTNRCINDVAIIMLEDDIIFDDYQQKINLPKENYKVGQIVTLTGWGAIKQIPELIAPEKLQMMKTRIISKEECQRHLIDPKKTQILDTEVCVFHSKGTGGCKGDSGGPLAVNGEVVGIMAWADGDYCAQGQPDVFTNVYKYKDFIESAMSQTA